MNRPLNFLMNQGWLELICRWVLGIVFIYASFHKIASPAKFAEVIYGYYLFPAGIIHLIAVILPFLEMFCGAAMLLGIYPRSAALILVALLLLFIGVLSFNLSRGLKFDCGCFSFDEKGANGAVIGLIVRDTLLLIMGWYVAGYRKIRKGCLRQTGSLTGAVIR